MRDEESDIEVFIDRLSFGRYIEYRNQPGTTATPDALNTRYIEAITDEEYVVCIILPQRPKFEPAEWFTSISIHIDGMPVVRRIIPARDTQGLLEFSRADALGFNFSLSFAFGRLHSDSSISHTEQQDIDEISRRGKITVCIQRGLPVACQAPNWQTTSSVASLATTDGVLCFRSHALKPHKRAKKHCQSVFYKSHKKLIDDPNGVGKTTTFTFFYVSKEILQRRGLVPAGQPATPSPAPRPSAQPAQTQKGDLRAPDGRPVFPIFWLASSIGAQNKAFSTGSNSPGLHQATPDCKRPRGIDTDGDDDEDFSRKPIKREPLETN